MDARMLNQKKAKEYREKLVGKKFKHFKGGIYKVIDIGIHSEDASIMVIYHSENDESLVWIRPIEMFLSKVDKVKYPEVKQEFRFQEIEECGMIRKQIWDYIRDNLKYFKLVGDEIADEDIDWIEEKVSKNKLSLEEACDRCLQGIRDTIDFGILDDDEYDEYDTDETEDEEDEEEKKYVFTFKVTGYHIMKVNAKSLEKAKEMAMDEICDVDFGCLEDIDSVIIGEKEADKWE